MSDNAIYTVPCPKCHKIVRADRVTATPPGDIDASDCPRCLRTSSNATWATPPQHR